MSSDTLGASKSSEVTMSIAVEWTVCTVHVSRVSDELVKARDVKGMDPVVGVVFGRCEAAKGIDMKHFT